MICLLKVAKKRLIINETWEWIRNMLVIPAKVARIKSVVPCDISDYGTEVYQIQRNILVSRLLSVFGAVLPELIRCS